MSTNLETRLRAIFVAELEDQLRQATAHLAALERAPGDGSEVRGLFRVMHTLKGAARAAGVAEVESVCHDAEAFLATARDRGTALSADELDQMRTAVDALRHSLDTLRDTHPAPASGAPIPSAARAEASVRVSPRRLEDLLHASSRLLIANGRVLEASVATRTLQEHAAVAMTEWRDLQRRIRMAISDPGSMTLVHRIEESLSALLTDTSSTQSLMADVSRDLGQITGDIGGGVRELRLRPFADALEGLETVVRDVAAGAGKTARLVAEGGAIEADRSVVDQLREALIHLIRNAVDHGIESPVERRAKGKSERGSINVAARVLGDRILVTVRDDGAGIDVEGIRRALRARGEDVSGGDQELINRLFTGGISTRARAGMISGRGIGLDAAAAAVQRMRGSLRVESRPGLGTSFTIDAPLALATIRAVVVSTGGTLIAIPTAYVVRMARIPMADLRISEGRTVITSAGAPVPLIDLGRLLGVGSPSPATPVVTSAIVEVDDRRFGLQVDALLAEQEIVVRPIRAQGAEPAVEYTGVALLATGELAFVLNVPGLVEGALRADSNVVAAVAHPVARNKRVLVVDDSLTTRTLEQSVLEAAGYDVMTAVDGADGWRVLQERGADIVVADVEMPRMDGLELCRSVRSSPRFREMPFILITALETPEDRRRGLEVGADAYLGKSSFEREGLLAVIEELIGR